MCIIKACPNHYFTKKDCSEFQHMIIQSTCYLSGSPQSKITSLCWNFFTAKGASAYDWRKDLYLVSALVGLSAIKESTPAAVAFLISLSTETPVYVIFWLRLLRHTICVKASSSTLSSCRLPHILTVLFSHWLTIPDIKNGSSSELKVNGLIIVVSTSMFAGILIMKVWFLCESLWLTYSLFNLFYNAFLYDFVKDTFTIYWCGTWYLAFVMLSSSL